MVIRKTTIRLILCLSILLTFTACGRGDSSPEALSMVHGEPLTQDEFEAWLAINLLQDKDLEKRDTAYDTMMSRLFDRCIVQRVLRHDAIASGLAVSEAELEFYLAEFYSVEGDDEGAGIPLDEKSRNRLLDGIRVQKFRDQLLDHEFEDDPVAIQSFLEANRDGLASKGEVLIRALSLEDKRRADIIYRQIQRGSTTFSEAAVFYGENEEDSDPVRVEIELLPPEVRPAIEALRPGRTMKPWENQGRWYLFHLVSRTGSSDDDEEPLRARATHAWREQERRQRFDREVARRVREAKIRIYPARLHFVYIPPEEGPLALPTAAS